MPALGLMIALLGGITTFEVRAEPVGQDELLAPKFETVGGNLNFTVQPSVGGRSYQLQYSDTLEGGSWQDLGGPVTGDGNILVLTTPYPAGVLRRYFRLALDGAAVAPAGFALIPGGSFQMGGTEGNAAPVHSVHVSGFYMAKHEMTKELWTGVWAWGRNAGYTDLPPGLSKGTNHPVWSLTWYDVVKWCNARSEMENLMPCYTVSGAIYRTGNSVPDCNWSANGYRLPTEAEWEKAARGGLSGKLFPWGDTIHHTQANYYASPFFSYDLSGAVDNFHPTYAVGMTPYTSPVGSFVPNGYGLYDMAGNMAEWCWDGSGGYTADSQTDPRGALNHSSRIVRSGYWSSDATYLGCARRLSVSPAGSYSGGPGFRVVRGRL